MDLRFLESDDSPWRAFVERRPERTVYQGVRWSRVLERVFGFRSAILARFDGDRLVGGLPFSQVEDFRGKRHIALPFADVCEPLGVELVSLEPFLAQGDAPWQIRSRVAPGPLARDVVEAGVHHLLALPQSADDLHHGFHAKQRHDYRQALAAGLTYRQTSLREGLEAFYELFSIVKQRKHQRLPMGRGFMRAIAEVYGDDGFIGFSVHQDRMIAASLFVIEGTTVQYQFNGSDPDALELRPNHFLLACAMVDAIERGCARMDLGLSNTEGLIRFKDRFGAQRETVYRGSYATAPRTPQAAQMEESLRDVTRVLCAPGVPLDAAQTAGDVLYRYFL